MSRILIVDDDDLTLQLYDLMFEGMDDHSVAKAASGTEAIQYLESCPQPDWPELIFIDLHMPDMSGFEFVENFEQKFKNQNSRLFILTSSVSNRDVEAAEKYPLVSKVMAKPLTEESLQEVMQQA